MPLITCHIEHTLVNIRMYDLIHCNQNSQDTTACLHNNRCESTLTTDVWSLRARFPGKDPYTVAERVKRTLTNTCAIYVELHVHANIVSGLLTHRYTWYILDILYYSLAENLDQTIYFKRKLQNDCM